MKKALLLLSFFSAATLTVNAALVQDTAKAADPEPSLVFTGSVDTYFKYDFSKHANIPTYFGSDQNSISIGMVDLGLKKKVGKASFVGELSFGQRSEQSLPAGSTNYHIQNLYVSYDVSSQLNLTAGYMGTFIGYEVISPAANFNYSTSYLFGAGPFQNAGFKATYAFSDKASLMVGLFNNKWNDYTTSNGENAGDVSNFGAQLMLAPVKGWTAYINFLSGSYPGSIVDLTTAYQITDAFKLGLNAAKKWGTTVFYSNYEGVALYPQLAVSSAVTFGLRGEYFKAEDAGNVKSLTVTSNIKAGPLTLIPEVRFDNKSDDFGIPFVKSDGALTNHAAQFLVAAVYAF